MTTLEVSNLGRYGFMGGRGGTSLREQGGAMTLHTHGTSPGSHDHGSQDGVANLGAGPGQAGAEEDGLIVATTSSGNESVPFGSDTTRSTSSLSRPSATRNPCSAMLTNAVRYCGNGPLLQILGLDRFTKGAAGRGMKLAEAGGGNPFDMGIITVSTDSITL